MTTGRPAAAPWQRGRLIWGALLSVTLGVIAAAVGLGNTTARLGLIIALLGANLTLVIDAFFRREETVHDGTARLDHISSALEIGGPLADAPAECRDLVTDLTRLWKRVDETGSVILRKIRDDRERGFREDMRDLAGGQTALARRPEFRPGILHDLTEMIALSGTRHDYWWAGRTAAYLAAERAAIAKGLVLRRVLVLDKEEIDVAAALLREQADAGIDLRVIIREAVGPLHQHYLRADRALVTDTGGIVGVILPGREAEDAATDAGHFTINKDKLQDTLKILAALEPYEVPAAQLLCS